MRWIVILSVFLMPLVCSIDAKINCPDVVGFEEEFYCDIFVDEGGGVYDLKIYIRGDAGGINRIWDGNNWQRSDWYVKKAIEGDGDFRRKLIIHNNYNGKATGQFKLRSSSGKIVFEDVFDIEVGSQSKEINRENDEEEEEEEEEVPDKESEKKDREEQIKEIYDYLKEIEDEKENHDDNLQNKDAENDSPSIITSTKVINLNSQSKTSGSELIYTSKNDRIKEYMVYAFFFFLICIIGILLHEKTQW
jgi:hypothetical protein